jgi:ABC-type nitrate/sulfonate/bicarbonate transport system substrate-binding protein
LNGARGVVKGLLDGEVLFGNLAAPALVHAVLEGAEIVYVTGGINQQFLVGRPGLAALADLANARFGANGPGELGELLSLFTIARLEEQGIHGASIAYGRGRSRVDQLAEGEIDAAPLSPPTAIEARRRGCPFLLDYADYGLNYTLGGLATTRRLVAEQPDLVQRFVHGYVVGMHRYKTDRSLAVTVQQDYSALADRTVAEETYATTEPGFPRAPYPVTSGLAIILDLLARSDPRAAVLSPEQLVEPRFVRAVEDSGLIARLYS